MNFQTALESDLHNIEIPLSFVISQAGTIHGLAFWFDVAFLGSQYVDLLCMFLDFKDYHLVVLYPMLLLETVIWTTS